MVSEGEDGSASRIETPVRGVDLLLELSPTGTRQHAVEEALRSAIRDGRLPAGTRLPPTRTLAAELGLSRGTVNQAYAQLTAEGWLTARTRAGTRVADDAVREPRRIAPPHISGTAPRLVHDLRPGRPDTSSFPRTAWTRAARRAVQQAPAEAFGYGDPRGRIELRETLAAYLGRVRGVRVEPDHLVICSGYTQALGLLSGVLSDLGASRAAMEDPAMADHVAIVRKHLLVADAPVDDEGMRMREPGSGRPDVVVCTPAHQFPLGVSMSPARRAELLTWATERDGWIIEDDYDGEFRYDRRPIGALQARRPSRIAYVGSTSKSLGPAVRLGWIACPPPLLESLLEAKVLADRQTGSLEQLTLAELITSGAYDRHLRTMRHAYRARRDLLTASVAERVPQARITGIAAGLHAVLELPPEAATRADVASALRAASVQTHLLGDYMRGSRPTPSPASLVIGYTTPPRHAYGAALDALLGALRRLCA